MHSTNYFSTFIEVAEDCSAEQGEMPPIKGAKKTIANLQFEMLWENPYQYTSDDIFFAVFAVRKEIPKNEMEEARADFFSKGQPCFRASPLTKRYGWGVHSNEEGKVAIFGRETKMYKDFIANQGVDKKKAMRSKRIKKL